MSTEDTKSQENQNEAAPSTTDPEKTEQKATEGEAKTEQPA